MKTLRNLTIEKTKYSPGVAFNTDGHLKIEGRVIPDNPISLFRPLFEWISHLEATRVVFDINLEYVNTSASMQLFSLLKKLEENSKIRELTVNWFFEEDDEDHYDTGLFFEEKLIRCKFNYQAVA